MAFTETTTESYGSRIAGSFRGILVGIVLILVAVGGLFWNEGRTVNRYKTLKEGSKVVVTVPADKIDSANEGKLIHLSGKTASIEILNDTDFDISVNAVQLERHVEMFQWTENSSTKTQKKLGGSEEKVTTYTYKKEWSSSLNDSSNYKEKGHDNPSVMPYQSQTSLAKDVTVGAFKLSPSLISQLGPKEALKVEDPAQKSTDVKSSDTSKSASPLPVADAIKTNAPQSDAAKGDVPKDSAPKNEAPKSDAPKDSAPKSESVKPDVSKSMSMTMTNDNKIRLVSYAGEEATTISVNSEKKPNFSVSSPSISINNDAAITVSPTSEKSSASSNISVQEDNQLTVANAIQNNVSPSAPRFVQGMIYIGKDPATPAIGDVRITYEVVYPNKDVSIISQQNGDSFVPYTAKKGKIELLENSVQTADSMFQTAQSNNKILSWIFRLIGFIVMFIGFSTFLRPLSVLADVLPFLGNLVGAGTTMVSFFLTLVISLMTIGIAWLFYRPFISVPLLLAAGYFLFVLIKKNRKAKNNG